MNSRGKLDKSKLLKKKNGEVKKYLGKMVSKFDEHKEFINVLLTVALIILTFALIGSTNKSIEATEAATNATLAIRDVELLLFTLEVKAGIKEKINLGINLLIEGSINKEILEIISKEDFFDENNTAQVYEHRLKSVQLEQAISMNEFGSADLRIQLEVMLSNLKLINAHLDMIEKAAVRRDNEIPNRGRAPGYLLMD